MKGAKVSEFFCCNPLCRCHITGTHGANFLRYIEANGKTVDVQRKKIIDVEAKKEFDFCEICANAVALVNEK